MRSNATGTEGTGSRDGTTRVGRAAAGPIGHPVRAASAGLALALAAMLTAAGATAAQQQPKLDSTRNNYVHPPGTRTVEVGTLGRVERHGSGPVPMVLVAEARYGGEVFRSFMEANAGRYTMYAVTLPGAGGTAPPPLPSEATSYMDPVWTEGAERGVVSLIEGEGLDRPVVVGHMGTGGLVAARLATRHPELIRGAVVMAGEPRRDIGSDDPAVRRNWVDDNLRPRWFKWVTEEVWTANSWKASYLSRDPDLAARLHREGNGGPVRVMIQYLAEFFGSDISGEFAHLRVPLLAMTPGFDADFLAEEANASAQRYFIEQWRAMESHPRVTIRSIPGARLFLWEDEPEATSRAVADFVARLESAQGPGGPPPPP